MSHARVTIQGRTIGEGQPVYIIGEIGINHNGSVEIAKQLIRGAKDRIRPRGVRGDRPLLQGARHRLDGLLLG